VSGSTVLHCCRSNAGLPEKYILKIFSRRQTKNCFLQQKKLLVGISKKKACHIYYAADLVKELG